MPSGEKISVGARYERLVFEHATVNSAPKIEWESPIVIGNYVVTYKDGSQVEIPVKYAENIMVYNTSYAEPMPQEYYRHNGYVGTWFTDPTHCGKSCTGEDITVGGFIWENPNPDKLIATVKYQPTEDDYCGIIIAAVKGLNKK